MSNTWRQDAMGRLVPTKHEQPWVAQHALADRPDETETPSRTYVDPAAAARRNKRLQWMKAHVRPSIELNQLEESELAALPPAVRAKALELATECGRLRTEGSQIQAQYMAEESAAILEGMLDDDWTPPSPSEDEDPAALAAQVRSRSPWAR